MKTILDICCGPRMFWFDPADSRALFIDKRKEIHQVDIGTPGTVGCKPIIVSPDVMANFSRLPFRDNSFPLVVFDPPHIKRKAARGILTKKYGHLTGDWKQEIRFGFSESFRVLIPYGTLIFKWAESDILVGDILKLTEEKPLFGHKSGRQSKTHWLVFMKSLTGMELLD